MIALAYLPNSALKNYQISGGVIMTQNELTIEPSLSKENLAPDFEVIDVAGCMSSISIMGNMESLQDSQE